MVSKGLMLLLIVAFSFSGWSQKKFEGNFYLQKYLLENSTSTEKVGIFVKGNSIEVKAITKQHNGIYRGSVKGWHYVRIPSNELQTFIENKNISNVNFRAYEGKALNDTMRVNNRINDIHTGETPLSSSLSGDGIILGFIDTGIDFLHPDFMNPDSSTRVMYLWDQTLGVNQYTPAQYGYGQHWDSTQINQGLSTNVDQWGHGSTVTGAACGNAFANGLNKGVAPNTDIIMVESNFSAPDWLATVVDAVEYIYHIADSIGKPCVVNASVGTYYGSHDALDPYALYIDSLINAKKGHLMVTAAGNSGDLGPYHLHTESTDSSTYITMFTVNPSSFFGFPSVFYEVWADTADFNNINFRVGADKVSPSHSIRGLGGFFNVQNYVDSVIYDTIRNANSDILANVEYWIESRDGQYLLQVYMPQPDSAQYYYRFETTGNGSFDIWTSSAFGNSDMENRADTIVDFYGISRYVFPDTLQTIVSSFQCSPYTIAVGNYANDSGYVNKYNGWTPAPGETRGKLAASSSKGPTRTGLIKPEVAASGVVTNSAFPLTGIDYFVTNNLDTVLAAGGMHYRNGGTSMSSPVVAGVAALFLEQCPQATALDFYTALINNTYTDAFTGTVPNHGYGYGKLDGFATLVDAHFTADYTGNHLICEGDSNLFTITNSNVSYNWGTGETTSSAYLSDSLNTYFIATDLSTGCNSDTVNISIDVAPKPTLDCLINSYDFCENASVTITENGVFNSVLWSDGFNTNPRVFTQNYNGFILGLDTNSCKSDTCLITITEQPNPTQPVITNNNTVLSSTGGYDSYQWYVDGILITGANDSVYTALQNGNYQVEVFNSFGCSSFSSIVTTSTVGINEFSISGIIYPNPNDGNFTIETNKEGITLSLYNSLGKLISTDLLHQSKSFTYKNLAVGTYFLTLSDGTQTNYKKIVVLK